MENFLAQNGLFITLGIGIFGIIFGAVITILERKLIVTRKPVAGCNGFSTMMLGCAVVAVSLWMLTEKLLYFIVPIVIAIVSYAAICMIVEKKEYPESERYTKEY